MDFMHNIIGNVYRVGKNFLQTSTGKAISVSMIQGILILVQ